MVKPKKYNSLKLKLANWSLKKQHKKANRNVKVCSLSKAAKVGVSFVVHHQSDLEEVRKILKDLTSKKIETYAIGYIPVKKPDDFYLSQKGFNFFSDADLDFRLRPKSESVLDFINTEFDILLDFGSDAFFPMNYVINLSKAGFKVGPFCEDSPFDLMMDVEAKAGKTYYYEQAIKYLDKFE